MIHEHPLAYVLGLEGLALLRSFTGEHDRAFVDARLAEIRRLLVDETFVDAAVDVRRLDTVDGYRLWARAYDDPDNAAFLDEALLTELVDPLPAGVALDAACGTGRVTRLLTDRGHRVIGVDSSPDMLDRARLRLPGAEFRPGDLHRLPVADGEVDLVVCTLALTHLPDLAPVFAEFARVLRPGGHLVLSDVHPEGILRGSVPCVRTPAGEPARLPAHRHLVGDYLRAALAVGLAVRRCEEPTLDRPTGPAAETVGPWELWPWCLSDLVPEAARAANAGAPAFLIWHFQRAAE
ncbi:MAG TPA: class I SAM-dependent methyltransferase [Actinophytocola sp.]|nr:class I SAM-dependent methyltransferase [Actinophytocola sp.]